MVGRTQKKRLIKGVDWMMAALLTRVLGRPRGRGADGGSQVDQALGEAASWGGRDGGRR